MTLEHCTYCMFNVDYDHFSDCFSFLLQRRNLDVPLSVELVTNELEVWNLTHPSSSVSYVPHLHSCDLYYITRTYL